ncbi:LysR family transcriptional regulator, partial [Pulveribacter sp.]
METKWLEDFVSLAETRSFSRSAQLRHVTQPAFSRRIQALEAWAGTDLVDRSSYPTSLTPAGLTLYDQALEVLQALQNTRAVMRAHSSTSSDMIEFAVPHTLAFTFFPAWVSSLRENFGPLKSRLIALNVHDAVMRLVEGGCDVLIAYHHPSQPFQLDSERYEMVTLGQEPLAPYAKAGADGQPLYMLPGQAGEPLPYLGYAPGAYLGRVTELILKQAAIPIHLDRVYETDMAEGLKAMALEGHGV